MAMAATAGRPDLDIEAGSEAVRRNLKRGLMLGMGKSASLGWFDITDFNPEGKRATGSRLVISCGEEEKAFVFAQVLRYTQCRAADNQGDEIHTVIEIVPCLTS